MRITGSSPAAAICTTKDDMPPVVHRPQPRHEQAANASAVGIGRDCLDRPHELAHAVRDPNGRAYNRTAFLPERRWMMQKRAD